MARAFVTIVCRRLPDAGVRIRRDHRISPTDSSTAIR